MICLSRLFNLLRPLCLCRIVLNLNIIWAKFQGTNADRDLAVETNKFVAIFGAFDMTSMRENDVLAAKLFYFIKIIH